MAENMKKQEYIVFFEVVVVVEFVSHETLALT